LTQEDDVEIHALAKRGWTVSAIARHTGRDRKTVAKYLAGHPVQLRGASDSAQRGTASVDGTRHRRRAAVDARGR
jgi:IS30 family transposase